jgi:nucleoside-diphosphate-sugar epimerase
MFCTKDLGYLMTNENKINQRPSKLPILIVTGASGFIGRHLVKSFYNDFYIYALARRSQKQADVPMHKNINWIRLDIGEKESVQNVFQNISEKGGADYIIHLAGYYDFDGKDSPEYDRTNVKGTQYILESAKDLKLKRFIFASSLTVTEFDTPGLIIDEKSPADAKFEYAISKKIGEEKLTEYSEYFPVAIIRLAAIYSDWCEYGPLYNFLITWLSKSWKSNILAGKGEAAVPYLHVMNLNTIFYKIIQNSANLPKCDTYIASPNGCTTQRELFAIAVRYNFGRQVEPIYFPKWFAYLGLQMMELLGRITGKRPFEKSWMLKYVDLKLNVNASYTHKTLNWEPISRFDIRRRLLFLIEHMKSNPIDWHRKNLEAIEKHRLINPNLKIYETMHSLGDHIVLKIVEEMYSEKHARRFPTYKKTKMKLHMERVRFVYSMFETAVRTGDRIHVLSYARNLASERYKEGFQAYEVMEAIQFIGEYIVKTLLEQPELIEHPDQEDMEQRIYDGITLTIQLIIDELEDSFDRLKGID